MDYDIERSAPVFNCTIGSLIDGMIHMGHQQMIVRFDDDDATTVAVCTVCGRMAKYKQTSDGVTAGGDAIAQQCKRRTQCPTS